jgi:hypothetical protein
MQPTTAIRDVIIQNITAETEAELETIESFTVDSTVWACRSLDHLLDWEDYKEVDL